MIHIDAPAPLVAERLRARGRESAPEIAEAMCMTTGNVRVTRHRALAALRRCLEGGES